ncbi:MAG: hypothetical protein V2A53_04160 [bacterium]
MMKKVVLISLVLGMIGYAEAADIYVPGSYATIQTAVNTANI